MFFSCPESLLSTQVEFERTQQAELRGERPGATFAVGAMAFVRPEYALAVSCLA